GGGRRVAIRVPNTAIAVSARSAAIHANRSGQRVRTLIFTGSVARPFGQGGHFNSRITSPALCHRSFGSLARQRLTRCSRSGDTDPSRSDIDGGSRSRIAAITPAALFPPKDRCPVAIS